MSLADDLLAQADALAVVDRGKPKQASLRRAISAAYYALFHLLIEDAVAFLLPSRAQALRDQLARAFVHGDMNKAAHAFASKQKTNPWVAVASAGGAIPAQLASVASLFVDLQQERHDADYNVARTFTRANVTAFIVRTRFGFDQWRSVEATPAAEAFLLALLAKSRT